MDLTRPLSVVAPTVDGDVLGALARADAWFTTGRLHRVIGRFSEDGIRRALHRLTDQGVVDTERGGNAVLYRLNREHLAAPAIIQLAGLRTELLQRMREAMDSWTIRPKFAALFGSAAKQTMTSCSDIDIFVVEPAGSHAEKNWVSQVSSFQVEVGIWTGNDVRVLEMREADVIRLGDVEPVLVDIRDEGVPLNGDVRWFRRSVRRGAA